MPVSMTEKQELIQQLLVSKSKAYDAEFKLLLQGKPDEADEVKIHGKALSRRIDNLIAAAMSEWTGDAVQIVDHVRNTNRKIQRSIRGIQDSVSFSRNIIKLVGLIDDIVDIADGVV